MNCPGLIGARSAWSHHTATATELASRDAGQESPFIGLCSWRRPETSDVEDREQQASRQKPWGSCSDGLVPRHDRSPLSSERFRWISIGVGCSDPLSRSPTRSEHQDRFRYHVALSVDSFAQHGSAGAGHADPSLRRQTMARLFWECLVQTSSARVRPRAALPIQDCSRSDVSRGCQNALLCVLPPVRPGAALSTDLAHEASNRPLRLATVQLAT